MTIDPSIVGIEAPPRERAWTSDDCLLYALGAGAGVESLAFTTENTTGVRQRALPTFAATVETAERVVRAAADLDWTQIVHGEQELEFAGELPVEGRVRTTARISGVYDKGSGALVVVEVLAVDAVTSERRFTSRSAVFIRGAGGFGGDRGPRSDDGGLPSTAPDVTLTYPTHPDQALLYRLSGDRHPLHSDPEFARQAGFPRPILHGLCTYGIAGRALLQALCDNDPGRLQAMKGRFSAPVFPGEELTVSIWRTDEGAARFQVSVGDRVVLDRGVVRYLQRPPA